MSMAYQRSLVIPILLPDQWPSVWEGQKSLVVKINSSSGVLLGNQADLQFPTHHWPGIWEWHGGD